MGTQDGTKVWDLSKMNGTTVPAPVTFPDGNVYTLAFSDSVEYLASGNSAGELTVRSLPPDSSL